MHFNYTAATLAVLLPLCSAQTFSKCNPLKQSGCEPNPGMGSNFNSDFTTGDGSLGGWTTTAGKVTTGGQGAEFTLAKKGDAPTIDTSGFFLFGKVEVVMKAAPGQGIVSSIVLESSALDEIDWEALGGDTTQIQTNYFGKGDTSSYDRATFVNMASPQADYHTYTIDWNKDQTTWSVDGNVVRTLNYNDAKGGSRYPQTPMRLRLGIWAGGDPGNAPGTIEWAGGKTDYNQAPFTMYVKSVNIVNYNPSDSYTYSDNSGSWQSVKGSGKSTEPRSTSSTTDTPSTTESASSSEPATESSTSSTASPTGFITSTTSSTTGSTTDSTESTTGTVSGTTTGSSETGSGSTTAESSSSTGSSSAGASTTESSVPGSSSGAGSSTGAGSGSGSASSSAAGATSTVPLSNSATTPYGGSFMGLMTIMGLMTAMLQL
ncbi:extracellular cell wall glucanase Crf1/allergen Asp F9 [Aspergillus bombycis]|uniref:Crh-like protein n=1 Tax=Aspergillus bombycis TaxID=109264 RepID=A0A1F8A4W4_9EURO|nr:extracellular cell wall glucanase Crf1/allergen Asp F9 [Aspergillus bombycis]OGM46747.1 extracellular cell wall glucanase Crf1/allergen Asp F9 [Aspergillus bombycis]